MRETDGTNRKTFLKGAGGMLIATSIDARSYVRILGANDRIRLGQLGCGDRGKGHVHMAAQLASKQIPVETVAGPKFMQRLVAKQKARVKDS
jgi:hypothetical protein